MAEKHPDVNQQKKILFFLYHIVDNVSLYRR